MICKSCNKEIANEFVFCPYCGAKVGTKKGRVVTISNNIYLPICPEEEFSTLFTTLTTMDVKQAREWLLEKTERPAYTIIAHYLEAFVGENYRDSRPEVKLHHRKVCATQEFIRDLIRASTKPFNSEKYKDNYRLFDITVEKKNLALTDIKYINDCIFFSEKEAHEVLNILKQESQKAYRSLPVKTQDKFDLWNVSREDKQMNCVEKYLRGMI